MPSNEEDMGKSIEFIALISLITIAQQIYLQCMNVEIAYTLHTPFSPLSDDDDFHVIVRKTCLISNRPEIYKRTLSSVYEEFKTSALKCSEKWFRLI